MSETEHIETNRDDSETKKTHSLGDSIERAMADADKRIKRLVDRLHNAAQGSAALNGAERDAKRVFEWLQAKAHELDVEIQRRAKSLTGGSAKLEAEAKREDERPPADTPGG